MGNVCTNLDFSTFFFVFELRARSLQNRRTDEQTDGQTASQTDGQDMQWGLQGGRTKNHGSRSEVSGN